MATSGSGSGGYDSMGVGYGGSGGYGDLAIGAHP